MDPFGHPVLLAGHQGKCSACPSLEETHCVWWWLWVSEIEEAGVCVCVRMRARMTETVIYECIKGRILCLSEFWLKFPLLGSSVGKASRNLLVFSSTISYQQKRSIWLVLGLKNRSLCLLEVWEDIEIYLNVRFLAEDVLLLSGISALWEIDWRKQEWRE